MRRNRTRIPERTERRISAATSLALCALTVVVQIATTILLATFLKEKASYFYAILQLIGAIFAIGVYQRSGSCHGGCHRNSNGGGKRRSCHYDRSRAASDVGLPVLQLQGSKKVCIKRRSWQKSEA